MKGSIKEKIWNMNNSSLAEALANYVEKYGEQTRPNYFELNKPIPGDIEVECKYSKVNYDEYEPRLEIDFIPMKPDSMGYSFIPEVIDDSFGEYPEVFHILYTNRGGFPRKDLCITKQELNVLEQAILDKKIHPGEGILRSQIKTKYDNLLKWILYWLGGPVDECDE